MIELIFSICIFHLKFVIIFGFFSYFLNMAAHIKNKTFNYKNAFKPLQNLAGYIFVVLIFSTLLFANSVILPDDIPPGFVEVINFNVALYLVTILILIGYSREILEGMMVFGYDVAKFLPFLSEAQKITRNRYNIDRDCQQEILGQEKKVNIW
jgi:hypothetical protein